MKAVGYHGRYDVRVAIVNVTSTAICGSDLRLYDGDIPKMHKGDILGHEFMASQNKNLKLGDPVVVPFNICCGEVARQGYDAMLDGQGEVITGWQNKMEVAMALVTPAGQLAKAHTKEAAPGTAAQ